MNREECVASFKHMLSESMMLGMMVSDCGYEGNVRNAGNGSVADGIHKLHQRVQAFLEMSSIEGISANEVLPLYDEIYQLTKQ